MRSIVQRQLWVLAVILITTVYAWPAGAHNLTGLSLLHCLGNAGAFRATRFDGARCTDRVIAFMARGGVIRRFEVFAKSDKRHEGVYAVTVPIGLPEYQYGLALQAADAGEWSRSLEHFERAVTYRPRAWSSSFYDRYREALAWVAPEVVERMTQEERAAPATAPQIKLGRKEQPGWDTPITIGGGWQLHGLAVRSWTALEHGFPVTVDLFWKGPSGATERQMVTTENMIANGGFELGVNWEPTNIAGWYAGIDDDLVRMIAARRAVSRDGRFSAPVVLLPRGPEHTSVMDTRFIQIEPQTALILWSAWIETAAGGNPHIFVLWFDSEKRHTTFEIPFRGNVSSESGRHYAGVLQVPGDASYMLLRLSNFKASGEALYDDLLLLPLKMPAP